MTLVLLPGMHGTKDLFNDLALGLQIHSPVNLVEYGPNTFQSYRDLAATVGQNLPEECCLVAESYAGPLAVLLACSWPTKVKGIVFSASFIRCPVGSILKAFALLLRPLLFFGSLIPQKIMEPLLRLCGVYLLLLPPRPPEELLAKVRKVAREMNVTVMVRRLGAVINADDAEEFRKIKCPSLYLRGAKDRLIPPANAEFMQ